MLSFGSRYDLAEDQGQFLAIFYYVKFRVCKVEFVPYDKQLFIAW